MPTALVGTARTLERTKTLTMVLVYKVAPPQMSERLQSLSMILAYRAAPVRELVRERGNTRVSGFTVSISGRSRMWPLVLVSHVFVWSKAAPVRLDTRLRAALSLTGVSKATLITTLRLEERAIGTELTTIVSAAELRALPRVRAIVSVLFPIAAVAGRVRVDERLTGLVQKSGFLTQLTARLRVSERLTGVTTAPLSSGHYLLGAATAREFERLIGFRSKISILRERYVFIGTPGVDPRYPQAPAGATGSRYTTVAVGTAGARYPQLPVFDDPSED